MKRYEPTGKYWIATETIKDKTVYRVVCPDGRVANEYDHPTFESADTRRKNCEVFFGEK